MPCVPGYSCLQLGGLSLGPAKGGDLRVRVMPSGTPRFKMVSWTSAAHFPQWSGVPGVVSGMLSRAMGPGPRCWAFNELAAISFQL